MSKDNLTVKELYNLLGALIDDGYSNREFQLWHENMHILSIPKGSTINLINKAVRFTDVDDGKIHYDLNILKSSKKKRWGLIKNV